MKNNLEKLKYNQLMLVSGPQMIAIDSCMYYTCVCVHACLCIRMYIYARVYACICMHNVYTHVYACGIIKW